MLESPEDFKTHPWLFYHFFELLKESEKDSRNFLRKIRKTTDELKYNIEKIFLLQNRIDKIINKPDIEEVKYREKRIKEIIENINRNIDEKIKYLESLKIKENIECL